MSNSSVWPIDRTLSDATTQGQSEPGSDDNEGALRIPQSSSITGTSPSNCLVLYPEHSLGSFTSLERWSRGIQQTRPSKDLSVLQIKTNSQWDILFLFYYLLTSDDFHKLFCYLFWYYCSAQLYTYVYSILMSTHTHSFICARIHIHIHMCCILICRCMQKHNDAMKTSDTVL